MRRVLGSKPRPIRITHDKSLAPYRECRGGKVSPGKENSGRGTFDRGDLKEVADWTLWSYYRFPLQ
jgi:hypothetical protein